MEFDLRPDDPRQGTIREEMLKIVKKRNRPGGRDEILKQLDGVAPPKPFISPEHYHVSYEYDGKTYPDTSKAWKRSRGAYLEIQRLAAFSYEEPIYYEEGLVMISSPLKGRTGLHRFLVRPVECFLPGCARFQTIMVPALPTAEETGYRYVRDDSGLVLPQRKNPVEIIGKKRTTYETQPQAPEYWKDGTPKTPRRRV